MALSSSKSLAASKAGAEGAEGLSAALTTGTAVFCWYASNIGIVILNKFLISHTGFTYPVFLTLCHMLACVAMGAAAACARCLPPLTRLRSWEQGAKVFLLSVVFCATVVTGNASLKYMPVSFNQAVGSTTPVFTAVLAFAMQGQREARLTYASLAPIVLGVVIASGGEPLFHALGLALCLAATALRGLKAVLQSILMSGRPDEALHPMSLLLYMSAFSVALLLPAALLLEPAAAPTVRALIASRPGFLYWLLANSALAYATNLTNFLVTRCTSALTLQVLGNAKGVAAAAISVLIFRNTVTAQGAAGYAVTVGGVVLYSQLKRIYRTPAAPRGGSVGGSGEREPLLALQPVDAGSPRRSLQGGERRKSHVPVSTPASSVGGHC